MNPQLMIGADTCCRLNPCPADSLRISEENEGRAYSLSPHSSSYRCCCSLHAGAREGFLSFLSTEKKGRPQPQTLSTPARAYPFFLSLMKGRRRPYARHGCVLPFLIKRKGRRTTHPWAGKGLLKSHGCLSCR